MFRDDVLDQTFTNFLHILPPLIHLRMNILSILIDFLNDFFVLYHPAHSCKSQLLQICKPLVRKNRFSPLLCWVYFHQLIHISWNQRARIYIVGVWKRIILVKHHQDIFSRFVQQATDCLYRCVMKGNRNYQAHMLVASVECAEWPHKLWEGSYWISGEKYLKRGQKHVYVNNCWVDGTLNERIITLLTHWTTPHTINENLALENLNG